MGSHEIVDESLLRRTEEHAERYLRALDERHVGARATREELMQALRVPLRDEGEDAASVIDAMAAQGERGTVACAGPRYFGFVIGGSLPVALAADWMVGTWDQNPGLYATSPVTSVIEDIAREWLLDLFDLPRESGLGFVTGGQMANFTCLAAARHGVLRRAGWDVEVEGLYGAPKVTVVTSAESHATIDIAMRYLGFGTKALVRVDSDDQGRMREDRLRETLKGIDGPVIICAQAGNVNTGAFDPLRAIGTIANERGVWLHVDGAFGLWARTSSRYRELADGIELADSWGTDAHKWLNVPYDCGVAIVRHAGDHRAAQMADLLGAEEGVEILADVVLNQALVRFGDDDELTRRVVSGVQEEGTCWLSGTKWQGKAAMRVSVSNWATSEEDARRSAEAIARVWRGIRTAARA